MYSNSIADRQRHNRIRRYNQRHPKSKRSKGRSHSKEKDKIIGLGSPRDHGLGILDPPKSGSESPMKIHDPFIATL